MEIWEKQFEVLGNVLADRGINVAGVINSLKQQVIELPSWAVGNSGTRYGVFREDGAAISGTRSMTAPKFSG